ncbi:hypothetical protein [Lysinibacillus sp. S2017]|nr:hypothetical protein [Lysinibacillus sp. S2017]
MKKIIRLLFIASMLMVIVSSSSVNVVSAEDELPGMTHNLKPFE